MFCLILSVYAEILDRNQQHLVLVQIPVAFFVPVNLPANQLLTITEGSPMIEVLAEESNDIWINVSIWRPTWSHAMWRLAYDTSQAPCKSNQQLVCKYIDQIELIQHMKLVPCWMHACLSWKFMYVLSTLFLKKYIARAV